MKKCEHGHYYDDRNYLLCPYCQMQAGEKQEEPVPVDSESVILLNRFLNGEDPEEYELEPDELEEDEEEDPERTISFYGEDEDERSYVTGWLVCIEGKGKGRDYRIHYGQNYIGRSLSMDIRLPGDLAVTRDNHLAMVYDPKSNQTFAVPSGGNIVYLNGSLLSRPAVMKAGDVLRIGNSSYEFFPLCIGERKW